MSLRRLHLPVVGICTDVRAASRMAHQEDLLAIDAVVIGVALHPLDCSGDVEASPGIGRITPEAVADIDANKAVAREVFQYVRIDLVAAVAIAVEEGAP